MNEDNLFFFYNIRVMYPVPNFVNTLKKNIEINDRSIPFIDLMVKFNRLTVSNNYSSIKPIIVKPTSVFDMSDIGTEDSTIEPPELIKPVLSAENILIKLHEQLINFDGIMPLQPEPVNVKIHGIDSEIIQNYMLVIETLFSLRHLIIDFLNIGLDEDDIMIRYISTNSDSKKGDIVISFCNSLYNLIIYSVCIYYDHDIYDINVLHNNYANVIQSMIEFNKTNDYNKYMEYLDSIITLLNNINPVFNYKIKLRYKCSCVDGKSSASNILYNDYFGDNMNINLHNFSECNICREYNDIDLGKYVLIKSTLTSDYINKYIDTISDSFEYNGFLYNKIVKISNSIYNEVLCYRKTPKLSKFIFSNNRYDRYGRSGDDIKNVAIVIYERNLQYAKPFGIINGRSVCPAISTLQAVLTFNRLYKDFKYDEYRNGTIAIPEKNIYSSLYSHYIISAFLYGIQHTKPINKVIDAAIDSPYDLFLPYLTIILEKYFRLFDNNNITVILIDLTYLYETRAREFEDLIYTNLSSLIQLCGYYNFNDYVNIKVTYLSVDFIMPLTLFLEERLYALICIHIYTGGHFYIIARRSELYDDGIIRTMWYILDDNEVISCDINEQLKFLSNNSDFTKNYIYERR